MYHISRIPTSITVITSAVRLTSQMTTPTSRSMMLTCHTVNSLLMSIVAVRTYHTSSMANSLMRRTGLYYYGARYMDPIISLWYGVDNLTEKYVSVSSYTYTESAAHLLSLVANVPITYVKNARLEEFISQPEGNCITIGGSPNNARILVPPYYLDNSKGGQDYDLWFRQFSHEVGHTKQIARDKGLTKYLLKTIAGYIKAGNHDDALREIEAEQGTKTYNAFRGFVKTHFKASVENLFKNDKLKEKDKIEQINKWWNEFKKQTSNKK